MRTPNRSSFNRSARAQSAVRQQTTRAAVANNARTNQRYRPNVARNTRATIDRNVNRNRAINRANAVEGNRAGMDRNANARMMANSRVDAANTRGANINRAVVNQNAIANARIVNNWRDARFSGQNYAAFRDYRRQWHHRSWWHNHYSRIILVGGGWWYWNSGYWYPAWGYDPSYSYYPYDGPIYGYSDLTPDQVVVNVQTQLRDQGYYAGSIDGVLGPQTRRALAAFQADHGLAVTSGVDEPTLATMGLS